MKVYYIDVLKLNLQIFCCCKDVMWMFMFAVCCMFVFHDKKKYSIYVIFWTCFIVWTLLKITHLTSFTILLLASSLSKILWASRNPLSLKRKQSNLIQNCIFLIVQGLNATQAVMFAKFKCKCSIHWEMFFYIWVS